MPQRKCGNFLLALCISSIWVFPSWILYNKWVIVGKLFPWVLGDILANYWIQGGGHGKSLLPVGQMYRWQPGTCDGPLKWGQSNETEPLTCGVRTKSRKLVSKLNETPGHPVGVCQKLENCLVCEDPHIWCQKCCECGRYMRVKEKHRRKTEFFQLRLARVHRPHFEKRDCRTSL